jgi:hypothetical protein
MTIQTAPLRTPQSHQPDGSFFIGRSGTRLPNRYREASDLAQQPVQPVENLIDFFSRIFTLNGYETGRVPRQDTITIAADGQRPALALYSQYIGYDDAELDTFRDPPEEISQFKHAREYGSIACQGVESFGLKLFEAAEPDDSFPRLSSGRVKILASRTYKADFTENPLGFTYQPAEPENNRNYAFIDHQPHQASFLDSAGIKTYAAEVAGLIMSEYLALETKN